MLNLKEVRNGTAINFLFEEKFPLDKLREVVGKDRYFLMDTKISPDCEFTLLTKKDSLPFATIKLDGNLCESLLFLRAGISPKLINKFEKLMSKVLAAAGKTQRFKEKYFTVKIPTDVLQKAAKAIAGCSVEPDTNSADKLHITNGGKLAATAEVKNGVCHTLHFSDTPKIIALLKQLKTNIVKEMFIRKIEKTAARKTQKIVPFNRKIRLEDLRRAAETAGYSIIDKNYVLKKGAKTPIARLVLTGPTCVGTTGWTDDAAFKEFNLNLRDALEQAEKKPELSELFEPQEITKMYLIGAVQYAKTTGTLVVGPISQAPAGILIDSLPEIGKKAGQKYVCKDVGGGRYHIIGQAEKPLLILRQGAQEVTLLFQNVPQNKKFVLECMGQLSIGRAYKTKRL